MSYYLFRSNGFTETPNMVDSGIEDITRSREIRDRGGLFPSEVSANTTRLLVELALVSISLYWSFTYLIYNQSYVS